MTKANSDRSEEVAALLPLKPQDYHILFVLLDGERHGYGMVKQIERETGGVIRLEAGNLYRSVRRLIKQGLIVESDRRPAPESDDERRRYYAVTEFGRQVVAAETERMRKLVAAARARLATSSGKLTR
ncbi:MAG: helix-turn-helix transcriptional regulator [Gemmatimonadota bacterium]|nr:MAG: helix-turn-helix transcriptional regulator [Gemmatimonadota bacterium]